jgi:hypothetical protein
VKAPPGEPLAAAPRTADGLVRRGAEHGRTPAHGLGQYRGVGSPGGCCTWGPSACCASWPGGAGSDAGAAGDAGAGGLATFMLSSALKSSVLALFERGDLDLLLSSPLPSRSIFTVRLLGVAAGAALVPVPVRALRPRRRGARAVPAGSASMWRSRRRHADGLPRHAAHAGAGARAGRAPHARAGPGAGSAWPAPCCSCCRSRTTWCRMTVAATGAAGRSRMQRAIPPWLAPPASCGCPAAPCSASRCRCWAWPAGGWPRSR